MHRSHSRRSYPFDKRIPLMDKLKKQYNVYTNSHGETEVYTYYIGYNSIARREKKDMHNKKQRQHNQRLCKEY